MWTIKTKPANASRQANEGRKRLVTLLTLAIGLTLLLGLASTAANAQGFAGSATLRGTVKDENGAVVTKATVTLVNEATKDERKTTSNNEGLYVFSSVHPGSYTLAAESAGFKRQEQTGLVLNGSDTRDNRVVPGQTRARKMERVGAAPNIGTAALHYKRR